jgi:hypothetical protein
MTRNPSVWPTKMLAAAEVDSALLVLNSQRSPPPSTLITTCMTLR